MNKDIYNTYDNYKFKYSEPELPEYLFDKESPEYEWDYGDTVIIPFDIDECYWNHEIHINIYNFRFELIASDVQEVNDCGQVELIIDADTSKDLFKQGIYYLQLQAVRFKVLDGMEETECGDDCPLAKCVSTLLPATMCSLYVR